MQSDKHIKRAQWVARRSGRAARRATRFAQQQALKTYSGLRSSQFWTATTGRNDKNIQLSFAEADSPAFRIGLVVVSMAVISGLATYLILTGLTPIVPRSSVVLTVLFINIAMVIAMIVVISWPIAGLWRAWRERVAGARLHIRIVALFSIIAALPAILLAVAATTTFSRALDGWFSTRTRQLIENSLDIANSYLLEHGQVIRTDIINMARDLDEAAVTNGGNANRFRDLVFVQAGLRDRSGRRGPTCGRDIGLRLRQWHPYEIG